MVVKQAETDVGRYRRLFETAKDGIIILDEQTTEVLDANPRMAELVGGSVHDLIGRAVTAAVPFAAEAQFTSLYKEVLRCGVGQCEAELRPPDGDPFAAE